MKRILWLPVLLSLSVAGPAAAADNVTVKDAAGATVTTASKDVTGVQFRKDICVTLADTTIDCFTELNAALVPEDTASANADGGLPVFALRKATPANTSGTDGDYEALQISAGRLWTDAGALLPTSLGAKTGAASLSVVPASDGFAVNAVQSGTWNITNVSGTVSLPTGAATAAKQPALGTAGTASADVISVQGIASGTALNVSCSSGCSGGTQYAEDAVAASGNSGTAALGVQVASPASTAADGDWTWQQFTNGKLHVLDLSANTVLGTTADAAWASGSGTAVSLLKTIATASLDTTPLSTNATQIGGVTLSTGNGVVGTGVQRVAIASDNTAFSVNLGTIGGAATAAKQPALGTAGTASSDVISVQGIASGTPMQVKGGGTTATTTITRPADAALYAANDVFADSTSAPTSGGFTLTSMCRASGGTGVLTDATFIYSTTQVVAGTIFIYDSAPTAQNDNAAWSVTDADQLKLVGTIPFTTVADALNSYQNVQNLNIGYTCSGSANLRYMVKITTSYTPASGDTLTIRAKAIYVD